MRGGTSPAAVATAQRPALAIVSASIDWIMPPSEVTTWLARASVGDRLIYGRGLAMVQGETQQLLRRHADAGAVFLFQPRSPSGVGFDFLVVKRAVVSPLPRRPTADCDPAMGIIYRRLNRAADKGERCPLDTHLAALTGLNVPQVKWRVRKLVEAHLIATRTVPGADVALHRIVTIVSTGAETAGPMCAIPARRRVAAQ